MSNGNVFVLMGSANLPVSRDYGTAHAAETTARFLADVLCAGIDVVECERHDGPRVRVVSTVLPGRKVVRR